MLQPKEDEPNFGMPQRVARSVMFYFVTEYPDLVLRDLDPEVSIKIDNTFFFHLSATFFFFFWSESFRYLYTTW